MRKIGLTGGIASGKSVAAEYLESLGAVVIDADQIARLVVEPGSPCLVEIAAQFGEEILLPDGSLNRPLLRERIFLDAKNREKLNQILHPAIRKRMEAEMKKAETDTVVLVVPLLLEAEYQDLCDEVWVIYAPKAMQTSRLMQRDGITRKLARAMIGAQMPYKEKKQYATAIIDNRGDMERMKEELRGLYFAPQKNEEMKKIYGKNEKKL